MNRSANAPAVVVSKLVLAFALGVTAFGSGLSVVISINNADQPQLQAKNETRSALRSASHYVASLPAGASETSN